jgi:hypothetical protein
MSKVRAAVLVYCNEEVRSRALDKKDASVRRMVVHMRKALVLPANRRVLQQ